MAFPRYLRDDGVECAEARDGPGAEVVTVNLDPGPAARRSGGVGLSTRWDDARF